MTIQEHSRPKPNLTDLQTDRINILDQIGKTSAANIKIKIAIENTEKKTIAEVEESFDKWVMQLPSELKKRSDKWISFHSIWTSRDKLVRHYCIQLNQNIFTLLNKWVDEELSKSIEYYSVNIHNQIRLEFDKLDDLKMCSSRKSIFVLHSCREKIKYNNQKPNHHYCIASYTGDERTKKVGFLEGVQSVLLPTGIVGGVGVGARVGLGFLGFAFPVIPVTLAIGSIASIVNIIGTDKENSPELYDKIKTQIIELGCTDIKKTELPKVKKDIIERIKREVFTGVRKCTDDGFACTISQYESIFESLNQQIDNN
jgi:hypothetical protein